jgi:hypothetical protein
MKMVGDSIQNVLIVAIGLSAILRNQIMLPINSNKDTVVSNT